MYRLTAVIQSETLGYLRPTTCKLGDADMWWSITSPLM